MLMYLDASLWMLSLGTHCLVYMCIRCPRSDHLGCSNAYNIVLALKDGDWTVETLDKLSEGVQPQISVEELLLCEDIIRADERVRKLAKDVGESRF